ncbi:MAG: hypothetical protein ACKVY0_05295 [Prosthecobacter sp.]|uniref:hypothetical protein n=1 Tax=Prosthecobacter sp. TaxID=1965333 RepID=UPI0039034C28
MPNSEHPEVLFSYSLSFGEREFLVRIMPSGLMVWDDYQARRDRCGPAASMIGDDEFTVSLNLSSELLSWFKKAATMLTDGSWTCQDESDLDKKLTPLFWSQINPRLPALIEPPLP